MESFLEYKVSVKVMALRVKVNTSKLMLKSELLLGSMQQKMVLQPPFVISSGMDKLLDLKLALRGTGG